MKRFLAIVMMTSIVAVASAQDDSQKAFSHMGIGISVGTTAIGINVSSVLNPYLGLRAGVNIWPKFKMKRGLHMRLESDGKHQPGECLQHLEEVNAKLSSDDWVSPSVADIMDVDVHVLPKLNAGHVILDYFPVPRRSSFHLSAGAHIGTGTVVNFHNRHDGILMPITQWNNAMVDPEVQPVVEEYNLRRIGIAMGDYFIMPDEEGNIDAKVVVSGFRPYLGLGFGRSVPHKRIGCQVDLGVQFWGTPKVYVNGERLEPDKVGDQLDDVLSIVSRIKVFPVLNFRLVGRIF